MNQLDLKYYRNRFISVFRLKSDILIDKLCIDRKKKHAQNLKEDRKSNEKCLEPTRIMKRLVAVLKI